MNVAEVLRRAAADLTRAADDYQLEGFRAVADAFYMRAAQLGRLGEVIDRDGVLVGLDDHDGRAVVTIDEVVTDGGATLTIGTVRYK